jgi:bacteriocin biosynthesis cyclodehydratase domain-containing protein
VVCALTDSASDGRRAPLKPLLLKHYRIRVEPPDHTGEEGLIFTSEGKQLVIRGRSMREFSERVVPLLDGRYTLEEIQEELADVFDPSELERSLALLVQNRVVEDAEQTTISPHLEERLGPQLSYLREVRTDPGPVVDRLAGARVTVVGLGPVGAVAATALGAAYVGHLRCVDSSAVSPADPYLAQLFALDDVGRSRSEVTRERIRAVNPATTVEVVTGALLTDEDVVNAVDGSDFILGCLDPGLASLTYKLNRACLKLSIPWSTGRVSAFEGIVGPTVIPHETACYLCYQGRTVACRDDPVEALADLRQQDESKTDTSVHRENLAFGAGIVGQLLALHAFQALTGLRPASTGRILAIDFLNSTMSHHLVLRKPWCPACFPPDQA